MQLILEFDVSGLTKTQAENLVREIEDYADSLAFDMGGELLGAYTDDEEEGGELPLLVEDLADLAAYSDDDLD